MTNHLKKDQNLPLFEILQTSPISDIPLDRASLAIAASLGEDFVDDEVLSELDYMAEVLHSRLGVSATPDQKLRMLRQYLYEDLTFSGNTEDYYNPSNSFLNQVLTTRRGIPISLAILTIEVARRIHLEMGGLSMPCHFMTVCQATQPPVIVDCFCGGIERTKADCRQLVEHLSGGVVTVEDKHFEPIDRARLLTRLLNNLKVIYRGRKDPASWQIVLQNCVLLHPDNADYHWELAEVYTLTGSNADAIRHLEIAAQLSEGLQPVLQSGSHPAISLGAFDPDLMHRHNRLRAQVAALN